MSSHRMSLSDLARLHRSSITMAHTQMSRARMMTSATARKMARGVMLPNGVSIFVLFSDIVAEVDAHLVSAAVFKRLRQRTSGHDEDAPPDFGPRLGHAE